VTGHRIGYLGVSSFDQNPERQLEAIPVDRVFTDQASGKDAQRPELEAMMGILGQALGSGAVTGFVSEATGVEKGAGHTRRACPEPDPP
jgi:hypothetical protein